MLLGYALYSGQNVILGQSETVITRDYVLYMTSNRVLIGAEIDKVISILLVTLVLAIALVRGQRLLVRSIQSGTEAQDLSRFVSPEIADRITTADEAIRAGDGELKEASVMFTDIEGFSAISERLSPEDLIRCLNDYFTALDEVIRHYGGVITQFEGDALLVTFNTVRPDPDHAANAVRTALAIQAVIQEREFGAGVPWKTRCGINTGTMVAGAFGSDERLLFTVHGDEVNIASPAGAAEQGIRHLHHGLCKHRPGVRPGLPLRTQRRRYGARPGGADDSLRPGGGCGVAAARLFAVAAVDRRRRSRFLISRVPLAARHRGEKQTP